MSGLDVAIGAIGALAAGVAVFGALVLRVRAPSNAQQHEIDVTGESDDQRIARLIEMLPFAAFTVDHRLRVRVFNAAAAALFGVDQSRTGGRALIEVIPSVEVERMMQSALGGETSARDVTFGSGSRERYVGVTAQPYEGGAMAIAADRTAFLAVEHARRDFFSDVSHELRTPLSAMKLMLETVLISDDDAEARALFLPQISAEVERMIRLVQDLLELARSDGGSVPLRLEPFDLTDVAMTTTNSFAHRAEMLGIEIDVLAPEEVNLVADRGSLTQVAMNLVDNAMRHTPHGGRITVEVWNAGREAILRVRDSGIGIPFGDLDRIFERFYVVDRSRSREHGGTGLGLAIAKQLVVAHGGTLEAESVYGHGAVFTMMIPRNLKGP